MAYYPSRNYGIVTDFLSWLYRYKAGSFGDILHCFEYPGLHQFFHLINYSVFKIVGTSHFGWYFFLALLHGVNGYCVLRFFQDLLHTYAPERRLKYAPFFISILFVLYPFNLEAVVWKACLHYLIITFLILIMMRSLIQYCRTGSTQSAFIINLLFVLALFTLELSFAIPILTVTFLIFDHYSDFKTLPLKKKLLQIVIPQFVLFGLYFALTKLAIGDYIGHYGADSHLVFTPEIILGNSWRYFFKNLGFVHFFPFPRKELVYSTIISKPLVHWGLSFMAIIVLALIIWKWKSISNTIKLSALSLGSFFIVLAPVINLFFMWLLGYENDRYGYLSSLFFIAAVVFLISSIKNKIIRYGLLGLYTLVVLWGFAKMMSYAKITGEIQHRLLSSFDFENHEGDLYILAAPDNFRGMYLFRDYTNDALALKEALDFFQDKTVKANVIDVAQYNHHYLPDSIKVDFIDSTTLHVGFEQYNNWFWRNGIGLSDYETDDFKVEKKPGFYRFTMKEPKPDQLFIYPQAGYWATFRWPYFEEDRR